MIINDTVPWTYDPDQALQLQENLSRRLLLTWSDRSVNTIAGIGISYTTGSVHAAIAIFRYPAMTLETVVTGAAPEAYPYIPGLLAFRVGPAILEAWERLPLIPDLVLVHGHGIAHPRHFGLASHIGLWINLPTIGVAKARLYGNLQEVGPQLGDWSPIRDEHNARQIIGAAVRTQPESKPVYVSPGYLIDLPHSIEFVMATRGKYRMPRPIQSAYHSLTKAVSPASYSLSG